jgi:hypothetical protein
MYGVANLGELAAGLDKLDPRQCVIYGSLCPELGDHAQNIPRLLYPRDEDEPATIVEAAHHWLLIDYDGGECPAGLDPVAEPERAAEYIISLLPKEFQGTAFWWQLTSSAGFKRGIRMRLAFWMDRELTGAEAGRWLSSVEGVDQAIYRANQPIYAARPVFESVEDPVQRRSGMQSGGLVSPPATIKKTAEEKAYEKKGQRLLSVFGDGHGGHGFFVPGKSFAARWVAFFPNATTTIGEQQLEQEYRNAPRDPSVHSDAYLEERIRGIPKLFAAISKLEQAKPTPQWVEEMNKQYAVVRYSSKTIYAVESETSPYFTKKADFLARLDNRYIPGEVDNRGKKIPIGPAWLKHHRRREYLGAGVVFEPGALERPGALNLWRGFAVEPRPGSWPLLQNHIRDILADGNEAHADYILNWMAYGVQHPERQAESTLVFVSGQGSGKGVVWEVADGGLFRSGNYQLFNAVAQITEKFNSDLGQTCFVLMDEALWGGDKQAEGLLKSMITSGQLRIEQKFLDRMMVPNRLHIVIASNNEWAAPIGVGDRRFAVFCPSEKYAYKNHHPDRDAYFGALYAEIEHGGREAMLYDLLHRDLSGFNIRDIPNTKAKTEMMSRSLSGPLMWLRSVLSEGEIRWCENGVSLVSRWGESGLDIDKANAFLGYQQFEKARGYPRPAIIDVWSREIQKVLGDLKSRRPRVVGETTGKSKPGPRKLVFPRLEDCRTAFDRYVGSEGAESWDDDDEAGYAGGERSSGTVISLDRHRPEASTTGAPS